MLRLRRRQGRVRRALVRRCQRRLRFCVGVRPAELILDARTLESFESFLLILEFAAKNDRRYPQVFTTEWVTPISFYVENDFDILTNESRLMHGRSRIAVAELFLFISHLEEMTRVFPITVWKRVS